MQIGRYSQLQEWLEDVDDPKDQHRHVSHLYGLYPSNQISPFAHPQLFEAAKTTLLQRGDEATGWSIGWKINLCARLLDGNHALKLISNMLKPLPSDAMKKFYPDGRTYPNLFESIHLFRLTATSVWLPACARCCCRVTMVPYTCCLRCPTAGPRAR